MMSRLFQNIEVGMWTQVSVVVFSLAFVVILAWVYAPRRSANYEQASRLPLGE